ncbi:MAG: hypothetical protein A2V70_04015 [Planctomycetes bacterium RBG_13_63_9]|nr:MAG: hypothetical protein A2V70_04015 [Planctomycetes bacterium RBG_13_63_9]
MATSPGTQDRTYQRTHPWLNFELDLRRASRRLWMNLGAVQSKCEHVANALVPPTVAEELYHLYLAKGIHGTTSIEGNTLSEDEVRQRIVTKKRLPKSQEYQGQEIDNIVNACNEIADTLLHSEAGVRLEPMAIRRYNAVILNNLPLREDVHPGEFRRHNVGVADYRGAPPEDCPYLLEKLCEWINSITSEEDDEVIATGVLRAILAHLYFVWIHPFTDGNGRTARLMEVQILLGAGMPTIAAHLLSNFYNQTRPEYYRQLSIASKSGGKVLPFVEYAVQGLVDSLDRQIKRIRLYQWGVAWRDYVYQCFRNLKTPAAHRRRTLALELGRNKYRNGVPLRELITLTPDLALEYTPKTPKTLSRDLNVLRRMGLIVRIPPGKVVAKRSMLWSLLPERLDKRRRR